MFTLAVSGQNLLTNGGFEFGADQPAGWRSTGQGGQWSSEAFRGSRAVQVEGRGEDQSDWRTPPLALGTNALYRFKFHGKRQSATGGTAVSGPTRVNRDFPLDESWREFRFVFRTPSDAGRDYVRLGQWHVKGRLLFDEAELAPVMAVHARFAGQIELGEAESIHQGVYRFTPGFGWRGANYHRPLQVNRAGFNTDRWVFTSGAELIYRLNAGGLQQTSAKLRVAINYFTSGALHVEAGRDGMEWKTIAQLDGEKRGGVIELPSELFPSDEVFIRLTQAAEGGHLQVNTFDYEATLANPPSDAEGETHFFEVLETEPELGVELKQLSRAGANGAWSIDFALTNRSDAPLVLRAQAGFASESPSTRSLTIPPHGSATVELHAPGPGAGTHFLAAQFEAAGGRVLFRGEAELRLSFLDDPRPGYWLMETDQLGVWWCESGWKIGRQRGLPAQPPDGRAQPVAVSAARGEYEPVQVVLRPQQDGELLSAKAGPMRSSAGKASLISVRIDEVAYVRVRQPTDASSIRGMYPDPLPPLRGPVPLRAGQNQPLWITFHVPRETEAGDYAGELELETTLGRVRVPLNLHVYNFVLPKQSHLKSAFGLSVHSINRYHRLTNQHERELVYEKYLGNFAEHRIAPYSFYAHAPIEIRFRGEGTNKQARVDFTRFDRAAEKWLDEFHFSTFKLPLRGMGGGTFHSRRLGELEGFTEGTPEHARLFQDYLGQIESHLRQRGWLEKAYTYWFDEPDPKDYEFVVEGMKRLKAAAPGIKRMLTEQPEPELAGHVEIWCALTPDWSPELVRARRADGEEAWWYICTAPKAPYLTHFIDHPGAELRLWPWQSWQFGIQGILIWETTYWTSPSAFPPPALQDPWSDPMSYVSGYGFGAGHIGHWGNGDGRLLYPPRRDPNSGQEANLDGPINSMRWENLRDGMEDYEYFWLLEQAVAKAEQRGETVLTRRARQLLEVPEAISKDLTQFTTDPRLMLNHRNEIARMIIALQD
jgi:hypothetical protein